MKYYVVATSQREAEELAEECGHDSRSKAEDYLKDVKAPPTDPYYASQYRIYTVNRNARS